MSTTLGDTSHISSKHNVDKCNSAVVPAYIIFFSIMLAFYFMVNTF